MILICPILCLDRVLSVLESELSLIFSGPKFLELTLPYIVALGESSCLLGRTLIYLDIHAYHEQINMARGTDCTTLVSMPRPVVME